MNTKIRKLVRDMCYMAQWHGKTLGLVSGHRLQRHEDGSYTITIRLVPEGGDMNVGGDNGVVLCQHRRIG